MKRTLPLICLALVALLAGCGLFPPVVGSGTLTTVSYAYADFSRLAAANACKVHVVPDTVYSVVVTCDDNIQRYLRVEKNASDSVRLSLDQGYNYMMVTFKVEVHMPLIASLDLSGASEARVDAGFVSTNPLTVTQSGASYVQLDNVRCWGLDADISGASVLSVVGAAGTETIVASGASKADLLGCAAATAHASLSGASEVKVDVGAGNVSVLASGASTLYVRGTPVIQIQDLSGASRVVQL
jgi:hypothetical protein